MERKSVSPKVIGFMAALVTFVVLSALVGGIVEFSTEMGMFQRLWESILYAVTNKLLVKLLLSCGFGLVCAFVASMVQYGQQVKQRRRARRTRVHFTQAEASGEDTRQVG